MLHFAFYILIAKKIYVFPVIMTVPCFLTFRLCDYIYMYFGNLIMMTITFKMFIASCRPLKIAKNNKKKNTIFTANLAVTFTIHGKTHLKMSHVLPVTMNHTTWVDNLVTLQMSLLSFIKCVLQQQNVVTRYRHILKILW